jgi:hypothetical protein
MENKRIKTKPKERYWTGDSCLALSKIFDLPYNNLMQDWPYEVADSKSIQKYLDYYSVVDDDDIKFTLMTMIIQAVNDQQSSEKLKFYWGKVVPFLTKNFNIHEWTIYYWSSIGVSLENAWQIAPYMRKVWRIRDTCK